MTGIVTSRRDGRDMPNFENLKRALLCQGEPDYVPLFEGTIAEDIKSQYLGRPVRGLEDEVDFCMRAGYDFVPLTIGLRQTLRGELTGIMGTKEVETSVLKAAEGNYNPFTEESNTRMWAEHGQGVICDEDSIEAFPWPKADSFSYDTVERLGKLLPDGAMAIINVGYIFTAPWMLMGLEPFCISLATGDGVAQKVIERVGKIQKQVVENLVQFDCVGAIRMPDDLGYTTGVMISPRLLREYIFPWGNAGAVADAENMRVDSHSGLPECGVQHHVGGFAANAREAFKCFPVCWYFTVVLISQNFRGLHKVFCLRPKQTNCFDVFLNTGNTKRCDCCWRICHGKQFSCGNVHAFVGGLCTQQNSSQKFKRS